MTNILERIRALLFPKDGFLHGKCVLVIDDGQVERHVARRILEKNGCRVLTAENGKIGLHIAETERPDVILLDCIMPGMFGPEVCQRLKDNIVTKDIPVIFLTGSDTPDNIVKSFDVGAAQFLAKPVSAGILVNQIRSVLQEINRDA